MPGSFFNASPSVGAGLVINSNESSVVMALKASNTVSWPPGAAVIVSSSWIGVMRSSKSATAVSPAPTVTVCRFAVKCSRWASSSYVPGVTPSISKLPSSSVSASYRVPTTSTTAPCTGLPSSNETCPRTTAPSCALAPSTNRPNRTATLRAPLALARYAFISLLSSTRTAAHGHTMLRPRAHCVRERHQRTLAQGAVIKSSSVVSGERWSAGRNGKPALFNQPGPEKFAYR